MMDTIEFYPVSRVLGSLGVQWTGLGRDSGNLPFSHPPPPLLSFPLESQKTKYPFLWLDSQLLQASARAVSPQASQ